MDKHSKDISEAKAFAKKYCNPKIATLFLI
jgi:hypothetical protein